MEQNHFVLYCIFQLNALTFEITFETEQNDFVLYCVYAVENFPFYKERTNTEENH